MSELAIREIAGESSALIERINATVDELRSMSVDEVTMTRRNAAAVAAAAHQAEADALEVAAARLRLFAERRIGQLALNGERAEGFSEKQMRDFVRLAHIPTAWHDKELSKLSGRRLTVDLFESAVAHSLNGRSHTAHAIYRVSLHLSARREPPYSWLSKTWDGQWLFTYMDPKSKRLRQQISDGDLTQVLEERAILSGRARPDMALLPIRGKTPLSQVLDNVRLARERLGTDWGNLNDEQKRALDGAYGHLDDLAAAIVKALNL